jgi:hypothetical protein
MRYVENILAPTPARNLWLPPAHSGLQCRTVSGDVPGRTDRRVRPKEDVCYQSSASSVDEFVRAYHAFADQSTLLLPQHVHLRLGEERPLSVVLAGGAAVLRGRCRAMEMVAGREAGGAIQAVRVQILGLDGPSKSVHDRLLAAHARTDITAPMPRVEALGKLLTGIVPEDDEPDEMFSAPTRVLLEPMDLTVVRPTLPPSPLDVTSEALPSEVNGSLTAPAGGFDEPTRAAPSIARNLAAADAAAVLALLRGDPRFASVSSTPAPTAEAPAAAPARRRLAVHRNVLVVALCVACFSLGFWARGGGPARAWTGLRALATRP